MTRILVTGTTGFVGPTLCDLLARSGYTVRAALRSDRDVPACISEKVVVGDIASGTQWARALEGVDHVVHVAARAHILGDGPQNSDLYIETNARGTEQLARAAASAGVRRFVYLSSIKVNGEENRGEPYKPGDDPHPTDAYAKSKWLAERHLADVARASSLETVIVRPPLVYGPGVKANFLRLMSWIDNERPLPFGAVMNKRSLVSIWNLCDLLASVLTHPGAVGRTWMVSDGEDLSTPDLVRRIGLAMNRRVRLLPVPTTALRLAGTLFGRRAEVARLCGSLVVDITDTRRELGWSAPLSVDAALSRTVNWFLRVGRPHEL